MVGNWNGCRDVRQEVMYEDSVGQTLRQMKDYLGTGVSVVTIKVGSCAGVR